MSSSRRLFLAASLSKFYLVPYFYCTCCPVKFDEFFNMDYSVNDNEGEVAIYCSCAVVVYNWFVVTF